MTMNPEIKTKWLSLLEGEFKDRKTCHFLGRKEGETTKHCCLGVLCELAIREGVELPIVVVLDNTFRYGSGRKYIPLRVRDWAGIHQGDERTLMEVNDSSLTFEPAIEYIKENM